MSKLSSRRSSALLLAFSTLVLAGAGAQAAQIAVTRYDTPNGDGQAHNGTYNYWDATYDGAGATTTDGASGSVLSGGTGKLTDGVIATEPWFAVSNVDGTGEYVGWLDPDVPTITFHFAGSVDLGEVKLYVDDSHVGGVTAPSVVVVNGTTFAIAPGSGDPQVEVIDLTGLHFVGDAVSITLSNPGGWVFLSEAQFFGPASTVPEPANLALMLGGLLMLGRVARRRRA